MKKAIFLIVVSISIGAFAQSKLDRADQFYKDFKFEKAIDLYQELADNKRKPSLHVVQRLADSYFNMSKYQQAKDWYLKLYAIQGKNVGESNVIKLVQCLKSSMEPEKADELLRSFYSDKNRLSMIMAQKEQLEMLAKEKARFEISILPFNSDKSDFAPTFFNEMLIFTSARDTLSANGRLYPWNNQPYLDIYLTDPDNMNFVPEKFLSNLVSEYHDSNVASAPGSKTVYFTRNYIKKNRLSANQEGLSNMQILKGSIRQNNLIGVTSLSFNSQNYSCGHPALSPDGKYLYFTSNMPGGYGDSDIYVVELGMDGEPIAPPVNLGPEINTKGREMFPYMDGDVLYFSSDGHYGLGGLDMFASKMNTAYSFELPLNLGEPINGNMDDFSMVYNAKKDYGYFASNRFGGVGDDDVYRVNKAKAVNCLVYSGYVLNKKNGEPIPLANLELYDMETGSSQSFLTDGDGYFNVTLPCNKENKLVFSKPRFTKEEVLVTTGENPEKPAKENMVYLTPFESLVVKEGNVEKINVNPIYFEYDKYNITPRAEIELEKVLFAMREFPEIKIKIESHTDARGTDQYNFELSDNRAKSTMRYLISKGIDHERIVSANGYGEYRLKNRCANGVECSEQEHLENRRSDFIIVEKTSKLSDKTSDW